MLTLRLFHLRKLFCAAAKRSRNKRYLAAEAPRLPLDHCSRSGNCDCRYRHLDDRRQAPRRLSETGMPAQLQMQSTERRARVSRRAEDIGDTGTQRILDSLDDTYYEYLHRKLCD